METWQGLGSPVFDKLEAELAKALMSLPATKGFEVGSGFDGKIDVIRSTKNVMNIFRNIWGKKVTCYVLC